MTDFQCIPKGRDAEIRIQRKTFKGSDLIDIRVWWKPPDKTEHLPTAKGVSVAFDQLPALIEALEACEGVTATNER